MKERLIFASSKPLGQYPLLTKSRRNLMSCFGVIADISERLNAHS